MWLTAQRARGATGVFFLVNSDCAGCTALIDESLRKLDGVRKVGINYVTDKVYVSYDPIKVTSGKIKDEIEKAGYKASVQSRAHATAPRKTAT